ncbi:MAG: nuclear transport factor 2 family protein, partial [Saprospiraceae bacterium]|nr:nuclear transport factor 2 family protein [Saprospiraceae bacterium]
MKNLLFLLIAFLAISVTACEMGDTEEETVDMEAVRAEIQAMEDAYAVAQNARDADGVVAYYADDAVSMGPDQPPLVGKAAILADIKKDMADDTTNEGTIRFEIVDLFVEGDLA